MQERLRQLEVDTAAFITDVSLDEVRSCGPRAANGRDAESHEGNSTHSDEIAARGLHHFASLAARSGDTYHKIT